MVEAHFIIDGATVLETKSFSW